VTERPLKVVEDAAFDNDHDPDNPGWRRWELRDESRFNGQVMGRMLVRVEGQLVRTRMFPEHRHTNLLDIVHGATTLALMDISIFSCGHMLGLDGMAGSVTLDLSAQFIGGAVPNEPLDSVVEILRETKRLVFLRGIVEQGDNKVGAFSATIRKGRRQ
jgi:acyl-coenzyme A thioesterase PaaI-like protein